MLRFCSKGSAFIGKARKHLAAVAVLRKFQRACFDPQADPALYSGLYEATF